MNSFYELAAERYSVRKYSDKPIEEEKLNKILEVANLAPTAHNNQPQKIYVLQSEEALAKINELSPCIFGAKTVFLIAYDTEKEWVNTMEEGIRAGVEDASIVATHMMLEAWELGIGSCWVNMFPNTQTAKAFGLPENIKPVLLLPMGYPREDAHPASLHTKYPEKDTMVEYL